VFKDLYNKLLAIKRLCCGSFWPTFITTDTYTNFASKTTSHVRLESVFLSILSFIHNGMTTIKLTFITSTFNCKNHPYPTISPFYKSLSSQDNGYSCLKRLKLGSLHVVPLSTKILVLHSKLSSVTSNHVGTHSLTLYTKLLRNPWNSSVNIYTSCQIPKRQFS
jgi:hypothetical protein